MTAPKKVKSTKKEKNINANKAFFDRWSKTYDSLGIRFWMRRFQVPALREIQFNSEIKILDLSCGTGELLQELYNRDKRKIKLYGLDVSGKMLEVARKKLPSQVTLVKGDVHSLPFGSEEFDYVLCTEAFHHYYSQSRAIAEMKRVLKSSGKIIIVDVNFFLPPVHWLFQKIEPGCVKINNKREVRLLFRKNGVKVIKQQRNFLFAIMTIGQKEEKEIRT
ncbi:class I SAM-dependent methyltransferase [Candidatus Woesearchaeota archaeon]|nr:class I SAM-dependent methyltransferase [Candidatus Woesearchaeota archaeon]